MSARIAPPPPLPRNPSRRQLLGWTAALPFAVLAPIRVLAATPRPGSRAIKGRWKVYDFPVIPAAKWLEALRDRGKPRDHAHSSDGRLWFTDWDNARIGWSSPVSDGAVASYAMPLGRRSGPSALAFDGTGRLYVGELIANRITRFDPASERFDASWELPLPRMRIRRLAIDRDGCIWCTDIAKAKLARLS